MDKKEKETLSDEFNMNNHPNDYKFLVQKLKSISESIHLLEKNFLNKLTQNFEKK